MALIDIIQTNPRASIIVIAGIVSFFISLINYFVLDKEKMKKSKEKQKELFEYYTSAKLKDIKFVDVGSVWIAIIGTK